MLDPWDAPVRGQQYSIETKRHLMTRFFEEPSEESLKRLARSLWAYQSWATVDFPVEERMLGNGRSPAEFREFLAAVTDGSASIRDPDTPDIGTWVVSELLETLDPDSYVTLNADARDGMEALGYSTPDNPLRDGEAYWQFVENVKQAVERYDLDERVTESVVENIPEDVPPVDVAQVAFHLHADDQFDFDLSTIRRA